MLKAGYAHRILNFIRPSGTSRGVLQQKSAWYIYLEDETGRSGLGEVGFIPGLSPEDPDEMEIRLDHICKLIGRGEMDPAGALPGQPGIRFALDTALADLGSEGQGMLFSSDFSRGEAGIPINGLIWMGEKDYLMEQIGTKIDQGFRVLKMKVGALDFEHELEVLGHIRKAFSSRDLELRLDANGAWSPVLAAERLSRLSDFDIHSLEQPIAPGQPEEMALLCRESPIAIALDEELIGISDPLERAGLLDRIRPAWLILKPGLCGGLQAADEWIRLAGERGIGWWATSALESNVGLNAIAQWVALKKSPLPQGLGTGLLYSNNIPSPLYLEGDRLRFNPKGSWDCSTLHFQGIGK